MADVATSNEADGLAASLSDAAKEGRLLRALAECNYTDFHGGEARHPQALADLHNAGVIDLLAQFRSPDLGEVNRFDFFKIQRGFCAALLLIDAEVSEVAETVRTLVAAGGEDLAAFEPNGAFREWCKARRERAFEGLRLIVETPEADSGVTMFVLEAGVAHDPEHFVAEAIKLTRSERAHLMLPAVRALGRMDLARNAALIDKAVEALSNFLRETAEDREAATAIQALMDRFKSEPARLTPIIEDLLPVACAVAGPFTRYQLAQCLWSERKVLTSPMVDKILGALSSTPADEKGAIDQIDVALSQWDLDGDRHRVLGFLKALLSREGGSRLEADNLNSLLHALRGGPAKVAGWYVVSLLLTGDPPLCLATDAILQNAEWSEGLAPDLEPFALDDPWRVFLCRMALGYLTLRSEAVADILVAAVTGAGDAAAAAIVGMMFNPLLLNFPSASQRLEATAAGGGPAAPHVRKALDTLKSYFDDLEQVGLAPELRPNERERSLVREDRLDFWRDIRREAERQSVFMSTIGRSVMLYGTRAVCRVYAEDGEEPRRVEVALSSHEHSLEWPRLDVLDPVGLSYRVLMYRSTKRPT